MDLAERFLPPEVVPSFMSIERLFCFGILAGPTKIPYFPFP